MAEGGEMFEMGEFGRPVEEDVGGVDATYFRGDDVDSAMPDVPVTGMNDIPTGWTTETIEGSGGQNTRLAIERFKAYMRKTGKLLREPDKDLNFRYNTRAKELEVQYRNKWVRLTQVSDNAKFYAPSNFSNELQVRLGLREALTSKVLNDLQSMRESLDRTLESDDLEMAAINTDTAIKDLFQSVGTNTDGIPMRELAGFDRAVQRLRGVRANTQAKIAELKDHIALEERKQNAADLDETTREIIDRRLQSLREEHTGQLEILTTVNGQLRSQIRSIRETIDHVLHSDTTLAERIKTLFREQGVTIASLLTALGFCISTIVLSISHLLGGTPPIQPPSGGGGVKKQIQKLGEWLKALAGKAAAALPGIIGAVVSWLLKTAGGVTLWLAEHLWALVVALVVAVGVWIRSRIGA